MSRAGGRERPTEGRTILLTRIGSFGDVLFTLPVVEALAGRPDVAAVDLLTDLRFADDARRSAAPRTVYGIDPGTGRYPLAARRQRYDLMVDLHMRALPLGPLVEQAIGTIPAVRRVGFDGPHAPDYDELLAPRSRTEHAVECYTRALYPLLDRVPAAARIAISPAAERAAAGLMAPGAVVLVPGARYAWKRWPARHYARLADEMAGAVTVAVAGHPSDAPVVDEVVSHCTRDMVRIVAGTDVLGAVFDRASTVVANNSGLTALAALTRARVVCVHSHTLPTMWRPWGPGHANVVGSSTATACSCLGPAPHDLVTPCGLEIEPAEVLAAVLGTAERAA